MQELNMLEVNAVSGGFLPIIIIGAIILSGCGAKDTIEKKKKKDQEEIDRQTN